MTAKNDRFGTDLFDDRLLEAEPADPALRERYERVRKALYDLDLSGPRKAGYAAVAAAGLIGALVCGSLALTEPDATPASTRAALSVGATFGLAWCAFGGHILARRRVDLAVHGAVAARMAFAFTLIAVLGLAAAGAGRPAAAVPLVTTGLALLIAAAVLLIRQEIGQSELRVREQILRLECRLTAAGERRTG